MISIMTYNSSTQTLICTSTGGPATSVTWSRDDTPLVVDGTTYEHSQIITDTDTATYQNRLRIVHMSSQSHVYTCTVCNLRGNSSVQLRVKGNCMENSILPCKDAKSSVSCEFLLFLQHAKMVMLISPRMVLSVPCVTTRCGMWLQTRQLSE